MCRKKLAFIKIFCYVWHGAERRKEVHYRTEEERRCTMRENDGVRCTAGQKEGGACTGFPVVILQWGAPLVLSGASLYTAVK